MKVYIDTDTIVARTVGTHAHHANAAALFRQIQVHQWTPVISAHGLAEVYSVLTGAPHKPRLTADGVRRTIEEYVVRMFEIEALTRRDYLKVIRECAASGWSGGRVYDAIHVHAARKAQCERIYTFNVQDFRQIAPDLIDRIMAP